MAAKTETAPLSLRPMSLRPGGGSKNPFERFAKGAGAYTEKAQVVDTTPYEEEKKKPRSEIIIFTLEQLESYQENNIKCPPELNNFPELQINTIEAQRPVQVDERDWRGRAEGVATQDGWQSRQPAASTTAAAPAGGNAAGKGDEKTEGQRGGAAGPSQSSAPANPQAAKIQKAEDLGRTAWQKGATQEGNIKSLKEVKGILNKLTPEKFDILSRQLLQLVTNSEMLHGTINLIFENAVAQPTFVAVYADLCNSLAQALPESLTGSDKSKGFRSILLNTCQDQFEEAADNRARLAATPAEEREEAERKVKMRTLGNIRLIAELFNKGIVAERIVTVCISELMGDLKADPIEDNVEALCELLTKAGKKLEATTKNKAKFEATFTNLDKLSKHKKLAPRMKFLIRDVIDLRKSSWVPRRDVLQAKKIDEIHAEAHAELGMVPTTNLPLFQALPALPAAVVGPSVSDVELFPAFRGGDSGWQESGTLRGIAELDGQRHKSAFFLDVDPMAQRSTRGPDAGAEASTSTAAPTKRQPLKNLSEDDRKSRAKSLFSDYLASPDFSEAQASVEELAVPGFMPTLVSIGLDRMLDVMQEKEQRALAELFIKLVNGGALPAEDFLAGQQKKLDQLSDLMMDYPSAPKTLGYLIGEAISGGVSELDFLSSAFDSVEGAEAKRKCIAACMRVLLEREGHERLKARSDAAKLDANKLLEADPDIDIDLPSVTEFLQAESLEPYFAL